MEEEKIRSGYIELTKKLIARWETITTMESCTAGFIASLITDAEGSSRAFKGSYIAYSTNIKIRCGVPKEIIEKYSVYSKETAAAMAETCKKSFNADYGIGITGTTGNVDPENPTNSEPGKIYFAIATEEKTYSYAIEIKKASSRFEYKLKAAENILEKLNEIII